MERGFEAAVDIYSTLDIFVHSPFYKKEDIKQSSKSKAERAHIKEILALKELYPLPKKKTLLVDDVCTTGNTLSAAQSLIHPDCMFVLAAHPLWIKANKENIVVKSKGFW
ncbi:phosphoribosyltransferase [uncultured Holdemanella sp.]|uniref:phosphoribosyltransferase n=1 Tax=uncultured Holdemanella sp. TaxID=1763549 RepID=UPI0025E71D0A|nr:phosphoribosyltransferase [uncultured Holdemanella sp.]